jgi:hypothetical protein
MSVVAWTEVFGRERREGRNETACFWKGQTREERKKKRGEWGVWPPW